MTMWADHYDMTIRKWALFTLRPRQNGRHLPYDIFKCIFLNENASIALKISLNFVPKVRINNIPALVQIMVWRRPGNKPLSEPMMVNLLMHVCVTRPQWVNGLSDNNTGRPFKQSSQGYSYSDILYKQSAFCFLLINPGNSCAFP